LCPRGKNCSKTDYFLQKRAKKCKKTLIFTPIFSPETNKSYKITLFTIASHPIFQNFPQKPLFFSIFRLFFSPFLSFFLLVFSGYAPIRIYNLGGSVLPKILQKDLTE